MTDPDSPEQALLKEPLDMAPWFHCLSCNATFLMPGDDGFEHYFDEPSGIPCPKCSTKIELWHVMLEAVRNNFMLTGAFMVIGANTKYFQFTLNCGEIKKLVFKDIGIPEGARVLSINYTPHGKGGCFPVELHSNTPYRGLPRECVRVYGRPLENRSAEATRINCAITWLLAPDEDDGWSHLLDAFRAYADEDWRGAIIPANIAAEAAISKATFDAFVTAQVGGKEKIEEFLREATYSHQLKVVLPLIAKLHRIAPLPDEIRGLLDRLRNLRNKVAHTGKLPVPLKKEEAAELIVAATFGFHYGRFFRRKLIAPSGS